MKMQNPLTLVIFGATGNLYADKLAKSLFILFERGDTLPEDFKIVAFARKDFSNEDFRKHTRESILKRGEVDLLKLDNFLACIDYFRGDFSQLDDFIEFKNLRSLDKSRSVMFHVATASFVYEKIFENMKASGLHQMNGHPSILIEKPFGKNENDAKHLHNMLSGLFSESKIFHIDHYLTKETVQSIFDFRFKENSDDETWNNKNIKKIKIIFEESNLVGSRGASYDSIGAFRDVGENHMLEILALCIMDKPHAFNAESVRISRAGAMQDLYIDYKEGITKGQYEGYLHEPSVSPNSKTETFFRIFLRSKNLRLEYIDFELEGGKGLIDMHSDITTTTVSAEIYFKDGNQKEFKIQPVSDTLYDSYAKVYIDAIALDQTLFVSMPEIISEWKLADELLSKWTKLPLIIYKKGSKAEDIR